MPDPAASAVLATASLRTVLATDLACPQAAPVLAVPTLSAACPAAQLIPVTTRKLLSQQEGLQVQSPAYEI